MSSIFNKKYVSTTYKDKKNDYPTKFCKHIIKECGIKKGSKILDIGCGDGAFSEAFKNLGMEVYGVDFSESAKDKLGKNLKKHNLLRSPYPFKAKSFDFVFSKSVVEHLREPDVLVDEAYRMLKSGGTFICLTPSWKHSCKEAFYIDHTHVTPFTKHSLEVICELSGFDSTCDYLYQLPLLWRYSILNVCRFALNLLSLPYRPFYKIGWSDKINKTIRFSKEAMLFCKAYKNDSSNTSKGRE